MLVTVKHTHWPAHCCSFESGQCTCPASAAHSTGQASDQLTALCTPAVLYRSCQMCCAQLRCAVLRSLSLSSPHPQILSACLQMAMSNHLKTLEVYHISTIPKRRLSKDQLLSVLHDEQAVENLFQDLRSSLGNHHDYIAFTWAGE